MTEAWTHLAAAPWVAAIAFAIVFVGAVVQFSLGMGFGLKSDFFPLGPNERVCFWGGWGGSLAVTDADARLTVSYVMNRMEANLMGDVRGGVLVMAAYEALAAADLVKGAARGLPMALIRGAGGYLDNGGGGAKAV